MSNLSYRRSYVDSVATKVSTLRFGTGPIEYVFLHGAGLYGLAWEGTLKSLNKITGEQSSALVLDLPGHGMSDWRQDGDYSPATLAADVIAVLQNFPGDIFNGDTKPLLIGHSLGGLTAAKIAAQQPDCFAGVLIIDITPGVYGTPATSSILEFITGKTVFDSRAEMIERAIAFGLGPTAASLEGGVTRNSRKRPDGKYEWRHHLAHLPPSNEQKSEAAIAELRDDLWQALTKASEQLPTRMLLASNGMVSDAAAKTAREITPRVTLATIAGTHNLHDSNPEQLANEIHRFRVAVR
ncbi:alpha/beta fold hydrolase [Canibacter zhoujuaniae]|uniref:alpha/beta fold hydrolase n=1 Tax=Canibacter zhoujuaniae TaxID=2708343 RepID=UPI00141E02D2|nr:alpha/beta hydrolase [Canibacter zhoujuaniae]